MSDVVLQDLTIAYRGVVAVRGLSGRFVGGSLTAVLGPNGAGKSSLLAAIGGVQRRFEGSIQRDPSVRVAYLPQAAGVDRSFPVRVHELVAMGLWARSGSFRALAPAGRTAVAEALDTVGLAGQGQRWIGELSAGQLQRALFARLLVQDAGLILLDEPFNAVDSRTTQDLLALLPRWQAEQRTVVAVLHDVAQARQHFDQALLVARECVAWGPAQAALSDEALARASSLADAWEHSFGQQESA